MKYDYKYNKRIPGFPVETKKDDPITMEEKLDFGTYIHRIFELGYKEDNVNEVIKISENIKKDYKLPLVYKDRIKKCINNFFRWNSSLGETIAVEYNFKIELSEGINYTGYIDRIVKGKDGGYLVIDYKTSKREKTRMELTRNNQLLGYAYAIHKLFNIPLKDIYCGHYYPVTDHFVYVKYSEADIASWKKREINKVWKIRKLKKDEFPPKQNEFCDYCEYKPICTKFNDCFTVSARIEEQLRKHPQEPVNEVDSPSTSGL